MSQLLLAKQKVLSSTEDKKKIETTDEKEIMQIMPKKS